MITSTLLTGFRIDRAMADAIMGFGADHLIVHSFSQSLHEAPREVQFYLHAAALKDCRPFAWSYKEWRFYELPPNVAVNVLPRDWIRECKITRE